MVSLYGTITLTKTNSNHTIRNQDLVETALHEARHIIQLAGLAWAAKSDGLVGHIYEGLLSSVVPEDALDPITPREGRRLALAFLANQTRSESDYAGLAIERDSRRFASTVLRGIGYPTSRVNKLFW